MFFIPTLFFVLVSKNFKYFYSFYLLVNGIIPYSHSLVAIKISATSCLTCFCYNKSLDLIQTVSFEFFEVISENFFGSLNFLPKIQFSGAL